MVMTHLTHLENGGEFAVGVMLAALARHIPSGLVLTQDLVRLLHEDKGGDDE
jgi:hypothetical protein